ncbi:MAG TPA: hypothetical protein VFZ64_07100 [Nocardioidaceae bacterium]
MTLRAVFYEEDDARAVAARLTGDGFAADVVRERLAGEDDDEDHPWAVVTDAPEFVVDVLVEAHDGWLDHDDHDDRATPRTATRDTSRDPGLDTGRGAVPPPLELPDAPRRVKGHFTDD